MFKLNRAWQHFIFCLFLQLLLPLMPLGLEYWFNGLITNATASITAAMYTISIGIASRNLALLGVSIFSAMAFSCVFGYVISGNTVTFKVVTPAVITILSFMIIHASERYYRHVVERELFLSHGGEDA